MSSVWINGRRYKYGSHAYYRALWLEEQRIIQAWEVVQKSLLNDAKTIRHNAERESLIKSIKALKSAFIENMNRENISAAEKIISDMRHEIISVQTDEKIINSEQENLFETLSEIAKKAPLGFNSELEDIRRQIKTNNNISLAEESRQIKILKDKANNLAHEISQANSISLENISEEIIFIDSLREKENANENEKLLSDIFDFGGRISFFDESLANSVKPLITAAKNETEISRLKLIRTQIKTTYGKLKEDFVSTEMFKRDFMEFLPLMQKAQGAENLCMRMEDLLTAKTITREEYNEVYKNVKSIFLEQSDAINDAEFAGKISQALSDMGYDMFDEDGNKINLSVGKIQTLETPYNGYRVRIKIGNDHSIATRLVRVAGSESEKLSVSEYQKQADIETGRKFCKNLEEFYKNLEDKGIFSGDTIFRKEAEEEALEIIVDESVGKKKTKTAAERMQNEIQRAREF